MLCKLYSKFLFFLVSVTLQVLYKLKTAKIFEKPKFKQTEGQEEDPFAIYLIHLCQESRMLCVAGATHVILFKYSKQEISADVVVSVHGAGWGECCLFSTF